MRLLVVSDIHGNEDALDKFRDEAATADILLCVGDLTHFGEVTDARKILDKLRNLHPVVRSVAGNCDNREIESYLHEEGVLLTSKAEEIQGALFAGLSGAMPGPIDTPYEISEDQIEAFLEQLPADAGQPLILVSHQPPYNTVADRAMKMKHVGSRRLSEWSGWNGTRVRWSTSAAPRLAFMRRGPRPWPRRTATAFSAKATGSRSTRSGASPISGRSTC